MRTWKVLLHLLLTLLLSIGASGVVSAKVASGPQNLGAAGYQGETVFNWLTCQGKSDRSTTGPPGCSVATNSAGKSARTPVGRSGQQNHFPNPNAPKPRNAPETIGGRDYSGHAIDRMQERGFTPSVIENAINSGARSVGNKPNTSVFTDSVNNIRVITNSETGRVITVIPGGG